MNREQWLEKTLAGAPPLSERQLAILRPIWRPAVPQTEAAPARQQEPPALTQITETETSDARS